MKDITLPLPDFLEEQIAEVEVKINGKKRRYNFRIESFDWNTDNSTNPVDDHDGISSKIENLRNQLTNYGKDWELIQIFTPREDAKNIQVLFRQKTNN